MKKFISVLMSFLLTLSLSVSAFAAQPKVNINSYEDAHLLATAVENNLYYDEAFERFEFKSEDAIAEGLDSMVAYQIRNALDNMSTEEAANLNESLDGAQPRSVIATVVAFLAGAGFGWLADKLLDYGAQKFCDAYGDYNGFTTTACEMLGF